MAEWLPTVWLDKINKDQKDLQDVVLLMDRLESCGVQCQEIRATRQQLYDQLEAFKTQFFPGGSQG